MIAGIRVGITDVVARLEKQDKLCPEQKFALVGYSQGAALMHNAAPKISEALQKKIVALVMYGDPDLKNGPTAKPFPAALQAKLLENCAENDMVSS
jgi:cutinase